MDAINQPVYTTLMHIDDAEGRPVEFVVTAPDRPGKFPLLAFSHGAFSRPELYEKLLHPIAAAGYVIIAPRHQDAGKSPMDKSVSQEHVWESRHREISLAINSFAKIETLLSDRTIVPDHHKVAAMGHSYGALIAQISAGATAGSHYRYRPHRDLSVKAVVAFSPPGAITGIIENEGWSTLAVPSLTITGDADVLPGFIDDWTVHKASFENAPEGGRWLWVGKKIDHYFGGSFGRIKPVDNHSAKLLKRAIATSVHFLDLNLRTNTPCALDPATKSEFLSKG